MRFGAVMSDIIGLEIHSQVRSTIMSARQKCKCFITCSLFPLFRPLVSAKKRQVRGPEVASGKRKPIDTPNRKKYPHG
jgi:hypothetical protein